MEPYESIPISRRSFVRYLGAAGVALGLAEEPGRETANVASTAGTGTDPHEGWQPVSNRKIRVGIAGYGVSRFGAAFSFQHHPNVEVVAVSDLIPERCAELARECRCETTYPSCEEMIKDDRIEAVFVATDAPSHARLSIDALKRGKHVASAVPAVFGSMEDAEALLEAVRESGTTYMMFETSCFHAGLYGWHRRYAAGELGKLIYSEGEYFHYFPEPYPSFQGWRIGLPPQWYPTHSNAYYIGVTGGSFTEVSCLGMPSIVPHLQPEHNVYRNPFGSEIALFRTSEGGMARMAVCWDLPAAGGETGRVWGQKDEKGGAATERPPLPPGVDPGGHGGSHGYLMSEFVDAILQNRRPMVDVTRALAMTVAGIVAHESALRDGELLKIPQFVL